MHIEGKIAYNDKNSEQQNNKKLLPYVCCSHTFQKWIQNFSKRTWSSQILCEKLISRNIMCHIPKCWILSKCKSISMRKINYGACSVMHNKAKICSIARGWENLWACAWQITEHFLWHVQNLGLWQGTTWVCNRPWNSFWTLPTS